MAYQHAARRLDPVRTTRRQSPEPPALLPVDAVVSVAGEDS